MKSFLCRSAVGALAAGVLLGNAGVAAAEEGPVGVGEAFVGSRCDFKIPTQQSEMPDAWHLQRLDMDNVWQLATGKGVKVAVIDTGVSTAGSLYYDDRVRAVDFVGISQEERDKQTKVDCQHGTLVTSLLAAGRRDDGGAVHPMTNFAGIAPDVEVVAYRALEHSTVQREDGGETESPSLLPVVQAVDAAIAEGVDIINLSLTVRRQDTSFDEFEAAIYRALNAGIIVVAAAGNGMQDVGALFPASFPGVITVGMSTAGDAAHEESYAWSPVAIGAPGANIIGLAPSMPNQEATTANQAFLDPATGTSYAAPIVSGVIALMLEYDAKMGLDRATSEEIVARLQATADPPPTTPPDRQLGWGIVNPLRALLDTRPGTRSSEAAEFTPPPPAPPETEPVDARMPVLGLGIAVGSVLLVGLGVVAAIAIPAAARRRG